VVVVVVVITGEKGRPRDWMKNLAGGRSRSDGPTQI